ncbi:MAG: hypothetical protein JXQ76_02400, partial [Campylobacterales bacterium]|nr:hypothetical protein [Campylobacterales bacterium]
QTKEALDVKLNELAQAYERLSLKEQTLSTAQENLQLKESELQTIHQQLHNAHLHLNEQSSHILGVEHELAQLYISKSWRLTRPLRRLMRYFQ